MNLVKTISPKTIIGNIKKIAKAMEIGDLLELYAVEGVINGYTRGDSTFGQWIRFEGDFIASNEAFAGTTIIKTRCRSRKCFLPEALQDIMVEKIDRIEPDTIGSVKLKAKIGIRRISSKGEDGVDYEYTVFLDDDENGFDDDGDVDTDPLIDDNGDVISE